MFENILFNCIAFDGRKRQNSKKKGKNTKQVFVAHGSSLCTIDEVGKSTVFLGESR